MDYWRKHFLLPAITSGKPLALIGIGDHPEYWNNSNLNYLANYWDPARIACANGPYCIYDIDSKLVEKTKNLGINAQVCDLTSNQLPNKYDWIFASDVIEHVTQPLAFMQNISNSLSSKGIFVLTTPNALYWRNFLFGSVAEHPEHLFTFNAQHFHNLARLSGLLVQNVRSFQALGTNACLRSLALRPLHILMAKLGRANSIMLTFLKC